MVLNFSTLGFSARMATVVAFVRRTGRRVAATTPQPSSAAAAAARAPVDVAVAAGAAPAEDGAAVARRFAVGATKAVAPVSIAGISNDFAMVSEGAKNENLWALKWLNRRNLVGSGSGQIYKENEHLKGVLTLHI